MAEAEVVDLGGVNVIQITRGRSVSTRTRGGTRLVGFKIGFTQALIEQGGDYYQIGPTDNWFPQELSPTEAMLKEIDMCYPDTPHLRRRGHLDQVIGKVRRQFEKGGWSVSQMVVQAVPRT